MIAKIKMSSPKCDVGDLVKVKRFLPKDHRNDGF
jgi:phage gp16-like protein